MDADMGGADIRLISAGYPPLIMRISAGYGAADIRRIWHSGYEADVRLISAGYPPDMVERISAGYAGYDSPDMMRILSGYPADILLCFAGFEADIQRISG